MHTVVWVSSISTIHKNSQHLLVPRCMRSVNRNKCLHFAYFDMGALGSALFVFRLPATNFCFSYLWSPSNLLNKIEAYTKMALLFWVALLSNMPVLFRAGKVGVMWDRVCCETRRFLSHSKSLTRSVNVSFCL